jgi:predicted anti-sigma-YlaC factor YlaD
MSGCEQHEVAIEMRLHGALAVEKVPELDAHLASCASCRTYEQTAKETTMALATTGDFSQGPTWDDLKGRFRAMTREHFWLRPQDLLVGGLMCVLAFCMVALPSMYLTRGMLFVGLIVVMQTLTRLRARSWLRTASRAAGSRDDLATVYRRHLDTRIGTLRQQTVVYPIVAVFMLVGLLWGSWTWLMQISTIAFILLLLARALHGYLRVLPRLRRERDALE